MDRPVLPRWIEGIAGVAAPSLRRLRFVGDQVSRARLALADLAQFVVGLATRDDPPREYLFSTARPRRPLRLRLRRPGHLEDALVRSGSWEPHVAAALCFFLRDDGRFVDVGANIGWHALWVAASFPDGEVVCFEPHPTVRAELVRNLAASGVANVTVHGCALGARAGEAVLHAQSRGAYNRGSSSLHDNPDRGDRATDVRVPVRTLDEVLGVTRRIDVIKIDTEGGEREVLVGATAVLARWRPVIVFEMESRFHADPVAELRAIAALLPGYRIGRLDERSPEIRPLAIAEVASRRFRADLVAVPDDGV